MTADPRPAARTWLTDRYRDAEKVCGASGAWTGRPCPDCVADAILSDAVVEWRKLHIGPGLYDPDRAQVVVRLPGAWPKPQEDVAP